MKTKSQNLNDIFWILSKKFVFTEVIERTVNFNFDLYFYEPNFLRYWNII